MMMRYLKKFENITEWESKSILIHKGLEIGDWIEYYTDRWTIAGIVGGWIKTKCQGYIKEKGDPKVDYDILANSDKGD